MKLQFRLLILFLIISVQLMAQSDEPDTIIFDNSLTADSLGSILDSVAVGLFHPADSLYKSSWSHVNITYSSVKLPAQKDTLRIVLKPSPESGFVSPIKGKVISGFGTARRPGHTGADVKLNSGDTVRCAFDGQVRLAKRFSGYGNLVLVRHNNGVETIYAHLSKICIKENQWLKAGDLIGLGGRTGRATTDHLHFETRLLGKAFNPEKLIDFGTGQLLCDTFYFQGSRAALQLADLRKNNKPVYAADSGEKITYSIRRGDTLSSIARTFGTTIKNICMLNNITTQKILKIGTKLVIQQKIIAESGN